MLRNRYESIFLVNANLKPKLIYVLRFYLNLKLYLIGIQSSGPKKPHTEIISIQCRIKIKIFSKKKNNIISCCLSPYKYTQIIIDRNLKFLPFQFLISYHSPQEIRYIPYIFCLFLASFYDFTINI